MHKRSVRDVNGGQIGWEKPQDRKIRILNSAGAGGRNLVNGRGGLR
ncbi:hypothetical protein Q7417_05655 [Glaesserella parasuis]|nr:hypothetical protein [Glaesserella parasuis]MDE4022713.1 hypothetical protein [Glaesserella parasuis]MDG6276142.1 hypothetical protein [Glaesserella parasuis]MDG6480295.1 hypothetical protein [Glaesserella parasuis]MDO9935113.1 hypothetical protein [Glaesserella parasuis]MDO9939480.1 hypothetical protein [Glaesserella parasuis]